MKHGKTKEIRRPILLNHLALKRGERILDLGCGFGEDLDYILRRHHGVYGVGLDSSEQMLQKAHRKLSRHIKGGRAELVLTDAGRKLPFPSSHFDAVFSVDLLECLPPGKRRQLLREVHRVLKRRGRVLFEHIDWDMQTWNATNKELTRRLVHAFCDWTQGWMETSDGWMGRRLLGTLRRSGRFANLDVLAHIFTEDHFDPGTFGFARAFDLMALAKAKRGVSSEDVRTFWRDLKAHNRRGTYFYSVTRYIVTGVRK